MASCTVGPERSGIFGTRITPGTQTGRSSILRSPLLLLTLLSQHADHVIKGLLHINAVLCGSLDEFATKILGERLSLLSRNGALNGLVAFVTDQHDRHRKRGARRRVNRGSQITGSRGRSGVGRFLDHLDLIVKLLYAGERSSRGDAVNEDEPFAVTDPLVSQRSIFLLTCCVQYFQHARLLINHDLFTIRVFDGRIIGFNEMV